MKSFVWTALVLLVLACGTYADTSCKFEADNGVYKWDFNQLKNKGESAGNFMYSDGTYKYLMNVCGKCNACGPCTSAGGSLCQFQEGSGTFEHNLGSYFVDPGASFALINTNTPQEGVIATMQNGDKCGTTTRLTKISMKCSTVVSFNVNNDDTSCTVVATLNHPLNCANAKIGGGGGDSGGISGGWVFIIIILVCTFVYVVGGCLFQHYRKEKAFGKEACPNVVFWRECPSLVKDGYAFTWEKLRGLCNNEGGGGGASYQEYGDEE